MGSLVGVNECVLSKELRVLILSPSSITLCKVIKIQRQIKIKKSFPENAGNKKQVRDELLYHKTFDGKLFSIIEITLYIMGSLVTNLTRSRLLFKGA